MKHNSKNAFGMQSLFQRTFERCLLHWKLFTVFVILLCIISVFFYQYSDKKYRAIATIIIKDEKKGTEESKLMESLNVISSKKIIENEIEVIQSLPIIKRVIQKHHLYAPFYKKSFLFDQPILVNQSPIIVEAQNPELISHTSKKIDYVLTMDNNNIKLEKKHIYPLNTWVATEYGNLRFTINANYKGIHNIKEDYLFQLISYETVIENIYANLKVSAANKLSSVINLQYDDVLPEKSESILNEIIFTYNQNNLIERVNNAKNTLTFIDNRLATTSTELDSIERKINIFKGNAQAIDLSVQTQMYLQNANVNNQQLNDIESKLLITKEIENNIYKNDSNGYVLPYSIGMMDPSITQLINSLNGYEIEYNKLKKTIAENNPILLTLKNEIETTRSKVLDNLNMYKNGLEKSKGILSSYNKSYNQELSNLPSKEQTLLEISRDKKIKSELYGFLLQKKEESEIAYASTLTDNVIISAAHASRKATSPNNSIIFGSFLFAFIGIPMSVVSTRDRFRRTISNKSDIESIIEYPIVGELEQAPFKNNDTIYHDTTNYEKFRKIRYALSEDNNIGISNKKLLITSAISGEGKSFVALNLAKNYADADRRIVLIDMDFKNPTLSRTLNCIDKPGITNYLSSKCDSFESIHQLPEIPNLYFVPVGQFTERTTSLLENGLIHEFINYLQIHFDLILFDSSPVSFVADAYFMSKMSDATLFVIKHGYSPRTILELLDIDDRYNLKNVSVIFNGTKLFKPYSNYLTKALGYPKNEYSRSYEKSYDDRIELLA